MNTTSHSGLDAIIRALWSLAYPASSAEELLRDRTAITNSLLKNSTDA